MNYPQKWVAGSAMGMLLALGLCGLNAALDKNTGSGALGLVGFGLFVLCGLTLLGSLLAMVVQFFLNKTGQRQ